MSQPEHTQYIIEDDRSDASSVTIDNDPDHLYFLDEIESSLEGPTRFTPLSSSIIDLTEPQALDGVYVSEECYEILHEEWNRSVPQEAIKHVIEISRKKTIQEACVNGIVYKAGQSVELHDERYLRICSVLQDANGKISFKGRLLVRCMDLNCTYIPEWPNELVWIAHEISEIDLEFVRRFVNIHFTNYCYAEQEPYKRELYCRLKETQEKKDTVSIEYISESEADCGYRIESTVIRQSWRGETHYFGSDEGSPTIILDDRSPVIVLDDIEPTPPPTTTRTTTLMEQRKSRQYTFGDGFCGAGGVSCGAQGAGLSIKWGFDKSYHATTTYRLNFGNAECETSDIFSFLTNNEDFLRVDITHGSPPCQTFSPAHTIECANDDANSACIFSCGNLIRKCKPRVHTMEETSGLFERHKDIFYGIIHDFIEIGYSVRWTILNSMEYGVPQSRRRLIIIASGPGETLPSFPRPTHGFSGSGLRGLATINQMISNIPLGTADHDIEGARSRGLQNRTPFDPNQQARTITCGGGDNNYHPSGQRGFTNREFACLQTFPLTFRFGPRETRKQIGNAVPPLLARAIYGEIVKSLQQTDERELHRQSIP